MKEIDVAVIGTGPAGFTAAIYAARANLKLIILDGNQPGGQLTTTTEVENFPGFPEGITGPELMDNMRKQANRFGAESIQTSAESVKLDSKPFIIKCANGEEISSRSVIISTGASAKYLGLPNEQSLIGKGVSACATCDGFFYRDRVVHVIGGGDTALEEALFLTKFASKVYVVHRRSELRASKTMQSKAFNNPKIEFVWNTIIEEIIADEHGVTAIKVKNVKTDDITERKTDGFFLGIGHNPNTKFLQNQVKLNDAGFIVTNKEMETNIAGVFACGDVQDPDFRQAISAAGSGCVAAISAERFLADS